jgi:hypothetical protein
LFFSLNALTIALEKGDKGKEKTRINPLEPLIISRDGVLPSSP